MIVKYFFFPIGNGSNTCMKYVTYHMLWFLPYVVIESVDIVSFLLIGILIFGLFLIVTDTPSALSAQ